MVSSSGKISQSRYLSIFKMPHPRLTREESQEQTRQRLIAAACKQVAERGFASTTVRDIAREAGYTQGAFYPFPEQGRPAAGPAAPAQGAGSRTHHRLGGHGGPGLRQGLRGAGALGARFRHGCLPGPARDRAATAGARNPEFGRAYAALMADQRRIYAQLLERLFALAGRTPPVPAEELAGSLHALARSQAIDHALWRRGVRRRHPDRRAARSVPAPPA